MKYLVTLALTIAALVTAQPAYAMPACCMGAQNQWDERCAGARFHWGPGYNVDDPGTWGPRYSPWDGDCQHY
jgi:hypothetical protein